MAEVTGYSRTQIILHWVTALAVMVAWFTHDGMEEIAKAVWRANEAPYPTIHTASGAIAMIAILVRLVLRRRRGAPEAEGSDFNKMAAMWGHRVLYALVLIVPLLGAATWFGGFRGLSDVHEIAAKALMLIALGHAGMAIFHQVVKKDGTLMRMIRPQ